MEDSEFVVQITKKANQNLKKFLYRDKEYQFNFDIFIQNSNYFYKNQKILQNIKLINLLNDQEEKYINMSDGVIQTFISCCQNEICRINLSDLIQLQFLSYKYEVPQLISIFNERIISKQKDIIFNSILFKIPFSSQKVEYDEWENTFFDTKSDEEFLASNLFEYIDDDRLLSLPIQIIERIFHNHFTQLYDDNQNKEKGKQIATFLFKCLDKYGRDASILFSYIDFQCQSIDVMNRLLHDYSSVFDFSMINSTLLKTTTQMASEMTKMKEEFTNLFNEMKLTIKIQQDKFDAIVKEQNKMKLDEEKRIKEREKIFEDELNKMKKEMEFQRKSWDVPKYHQVLREIITSNVFLNLTDESKKYILNEIIKNPINYNSEQVTYSLAKQASCAIDIISKSNLFGCDFSNFDLVYEIINNKVIRFDMIESLYKNNALDYTIINLMNSFKDIKIEINFPSDNYKQIIDIISDIRNKNEKQFSHIKTSFFISRINENDIEYFKGNQLINECLIKSTVTEIPEKAFNGCSNLKYIDISTGVEQIGPRAFEECSSLVQISIPSSVTSIGELCFQGCSSLTEISIPSSITTIKRSTFFGCPSLKKLSLPISLDTVEFDAFNGCRSISISGEIKTIPKDFLRRCSTIEKVSIFSPVTSFGSYSFSGCSSLIYVAIPSSVISINDYFFNHCASLTQISIPSSVISIGTYAFNDCPKLALIIFESPSSVNTIGYGSFYNCCSLAQISIPSSVKSIGQRAFMKCSALEQIVFEKPSHISSIGAYSFCECYSIKKIEIPTSVTTISEFSFDDCESLIEVLLPSSLISIENDALKNCNKLKQIAIPSSVTKIGKNAFLNCTALEQITFENPSSLKSIEDHAFSSCSSLKQITIPSSVTKIGQYAFSYCTILEQLSFENPSSLELIDYAAFTECSLLKMNTIPSYVYEIGKYAFD